MAFHSQLKLTWIFLLQLQRTLGISLLTTSAFYLLLGTTAASYFGSETRSSVNLNFLNFTFGFDPVKLSNVALVFARIASGIVVLFPALDTLSVFPLIANTLGNNQYAAAGPKSIKWLGRRIVWLRSLRSGNKSRYCELPLDRRKLVLAKASKIALMFWRLASALPPLIGSLFATDLSFSLLLAGVAGVYVAFLAPSLLQITSSRMDSDYNTYSGWYSRTSLCFPVLIFAVFSIGVVLLQIREAILYAGFWSRAVSP